MLKLYPYIGRYNSRKQQMFKKRYNKLAKIADFVVETKVFYFRTIFLLN